MASQQLTKNCPACTTVNKQVALACDVCGEILPDPFDNSQSKWICYRCTYKNRDELSWCEACNSSREANLFSQKDVVSPSNSLPSNPPTPKRPGFNRQKSSLSEEFRVQLEQKLTSLVKNISDFCHEAKRMYEDPDFPPTVASIYKKKELESGLLPFKDGKSVSHWSRPRQIQVSSCDRGFKWTLFNEPKSTDIVQGYLGNCWFASALSVLAERRTLLERIFVTKSINPNGVYAMRLCKDGRWVDVIVDDRLPCTSDGRLCFCKGRRKQLWVPLLEKAMAKVFGSYSALISGTTQEGLAVLTGFPCETIDFETMRRERALNKDDVDLVWARLLSCIESRLLMGCSSGYKSLHPQELDAVGLVSNHAYSILDVRLVHGEKLLRLRNTWGRFAWTGNWSEHSSCWRVVPPDMRAKLSTKGSQEGLFWISLDDWMKYFSAVHICFVRDSGHEARLFNKFPNAHDHNLNSSILYILERTNVDLSLHQQSTRGEKYLDMIDILLLVYDDKWRLVAHTKRSIRNHVTCSVVLETGSYYVYCLSFTQWQSREHIDYTLVAHSNNPLIMEQITLPLTTISDALIRLVLAVGTLTMSDDTGLMRKYALDKGWSGQIVVAVNNHPSRFFHVKCEWTESLNLIFSRNATIMDIVPPNCRSVLNILTQLERTASFSLRCKQNFVGARFPQPQRWGYRTEHNPSITKDMLALHGVRGC
ncbi:calpain-15-like isoform X2 [Watersipora subatra]|uniref:calpain-15-like isoform X2 n=1 Tax=Watersipora subatra TaxID=2589382 RepID=UPI00355AE400